MEIKRDLYLKKLISFMWDGQVKVITGIRRCGKSYLLRVIFRNYLPAQGVSEDHTQCEMFLRNTKYPPASDMK